MAVIDALKLLITGDSSQFSREVDRAKNKTKELQSLTGRIGGAFGEKSSLGLLGKVSRGAGPIAGLFATGKLLAGITEWIPKIEREAAKAGGGFWGWTDALTKGTFILSDFRRAWDNITGAPQRAADAAAYIKDIADSAKALDQFRTSGSNLRSEINEMAMDFRQDAAIAGVFGTERETLQLKFDTESDFERITAAMDKAKKGADAFRAALTGVMAGIVNSATAERIIASQAAAMNYAGSTALAAANKKAMAELGALMAKEAASSISEGIKNGFESAAKTRDLLKLVTGSAASAIAGGQAGYLGPMENQLKALMAQRSDPIGFASMSSPGEAAGIAAAQAARMQFGPDVESRTEKEITRIREGMDEIRRNLRVE